MRATLFLCVVFVGCSTGSADTDAASLGGRGPDAYQLRVTGTCANGQFASSIGADGTITCGMPDMSAADIVGVTTPAGSGLTGGASSGDVSLALAVCPAGQILKRDGTGWTCAADADSFAARACPTGQLLKASDAGWVCAPDDDTPLPTCGQGQVLKSNGTTWLCANDETMTGSNVSCPAGQVLKSNGAGTVCAPDEGIRSVSTQAGSGLVGGGSTSALTLALAACADGQVQKAIDGGWACGADDGLRAVTPALNGGLTGTASALSLTGCAAGEVLKSNGIGWACAADTTGVTAVSPRSGGGLVGGPTTLSLAPCAVNEVLKATSTGNWVCAADANAGGDLTGVVTPPTGGLVGGAATGDATLTLTNCPAGQLLKSTGVNTWACAADNNAGGDITGVVTPPTGGLVGGAVTGDSTLTLANCPAGQVLKSTGTNTWACAADNNTGGDMTGVITPSTGGLVGGSASGDATLSLSPCTIDQVLRFDGAQWSCAAYVAPLTAGAGITITSGSISASFTTPGTEAGTGTTVARGDHLHDARYQLLGARTIIVRSTGTPAQNGLALQAAINGITNPSATNRWLIKLEPGEYDVGTLGYVGKSYVDLEGSGRSVTLVTGSTNGPLITMREVSEVRELTVVHPGGTAFPTAVQLTTGPAGAAAARRITAAASNGTTSTTGVLITGTGLGRIEESQMQMTVSAGFGFGVRTASGTQPIVRRSTIQVSGTAGSPYGFQFADGALILEDSKITTTSSVLTIGLSAGTSASPQMTINSLDVDIAGAAVGSRGIEFFGGVLSLRNSTVTGSLAVVGMITTDTTVNMENVKLEALGAPAMFIRHGATGTRRININACQLSSNTAAAIAFAPPITNGGTEDVRVGATLLDSPNFNTVSLNSTLKCVGAYNNNYDPLAPNCN